MKLIISIIAFILFLQTSHAGEKRIVVNSVVAVPVAVPVATYSPVAYSNGVLPYIPPPKDPYEKLLDDLAERVAAKLGSGEVRALAKPTVFSSHCAKCHTAQAAEKADDGRPVFGPLDSLSGDQLDDCMDAVLFDRMPKGGNLTPEEAGELLKELSAAKKSKRQADVPPKPEPGM